MAQRSLGRCLSTAWRQQLAQHTRLHSRAAGSTWGPSAAHAAAPGPYSAYSTRGIATLAASGRGAPPRSSDVARHGRADPGLPRRALHTSAPRGAKARPIQYKVVEERHADSFPVHIKALDLIEDVVTLVNRSDAPVQLAGWHVVSETGRQRYAVPDLTLDPGATLRIWSGRDAESHATGPADLFWTRRFVWNNHGDTSVLLGPDDVEASRMRVEPTRALPKKRVTKAMLEKELAATHEELDHTIHEYESLQAQLRAAAEAQEALSAEVQALASQLASKPAEIAHESYEPVAAAPETVDEEPWTDVTVEEVMAALVDDDAEGDAAASAMLFEDSYDEEDDVWVVGDADTVPTQHLRGGCSCGACGFDAAGQSHLNFVCHCSVCRGASGTPSVAAAGFAPASVSWINREGMRESKPPGSRNTRLHCSSCSGYVGEIAPTLGVIALPLDAAEEVHDCYKPNHHIFYSSRAEDVDDDSLPKWDTLPGGRLAEGCDWEGANQDWSIDPESVRQWQPHSGRFRKDVRPVSPTRAPEPEEYVFTHVDAPSNHVTKISPEKVQERVQFKYDPSPGKYVTRTERVRDTVIIGGGHNGLVASAYLAEAGQDVLVLERRHLLGGAAVTEELVPGFKFSRASYLAGLFRPQIIKDLGLEDHGFEYLPRDPSSFTPTRADCTGPNAGKSLLFWNDLKKTQESIAQFSAKDAEAYPHYEHFLGQVRRMITPILDGPLPEFSGHSWAEQRRTLSQVKDLISIGWANKEAVIPFYELLTAPASHILDRYFESEMLKTTLATDSVIGAMASPKDAGSAYLLLHHVMGGAAGQEGVWAYVRGGMGALSNAVVGAATQRGAEFATNATVERILYEPVARPKRGQPKYKAVGVKMLDGSEIRAKTVLANCTPYHAFLELLPGMSRDAGNEDEESPLPRDFARHIRFADYSCGALKINLAVDSLPEFACAPSPAGGVPGPHHRGTIHFENTMEEIEIAQREASMGMPATRPVVEMTIPSAVDNTLAPEGKHVVQLFVQFAPYDVDPKFGSWADPEFKKAFARRVYSVVDEYAPGFSNSIIAEDVLTPLDLERIFGLHKGNIMHMSQTLHQLGYSRPAPGYSHHRTPLEGLYLCGAGAHPGGGVMGAAGRNCARIVLDDVCC